MDTRNGDLYPTKLDAIEAGVPEHHVEEVDVITIEAGPFKGRKYVRLEDGRLGRRVQDAKPSLVPA